LLTTRHGVLVDLIAVPGESSTPRTMVVIGKPGGGQKVDKHR
jgi:hypothetical protein